MKVSLSDLKASMRRPPSIFIGTASFEDRCLSIANAIDRSCLKYSFVLQNGDHLAEVKSNTEKLVAILGINSVVVPISTNSPTSTADVILANVIQRLPLGDGVCLIDITTFTHEQLLILLKLMSVRPIGNEVVLAYTGADQYSVNTSDEDKWLSKGVGDVRSVLGFPGQMLPSRKFHLILLVGFEHERAQNVIERYEPTIISLGIGHPAKSVTPQHYGTNKVFFDRLRKFIEALQLSTSSVRQFEFSCVDPIEVREVLLSQVEQVPDHNVTICPMNTKLSTVGAGLAAMKNESIQLSYAQAVEYNTQGYSTPGTSVTMFALKELK